MNKEDVQELMDYNLEYIEAQQSEEIFGGDYTSAVDLKYVNKQLDKYKEVLDNIKIKINYWEKEVYTGQSEAIIEDLKELLEEIE